MDFAIHEFVEFLNENTTQDYGDFKREASYQLARLQQALRPLSEEQNWHLQKMREQLLWSFKSDPGEMREWLSEEAIRLSKIGQVEL